MLEKLQAIVRRLDQVERQLSDPAIYADREMLTRLSREQKELTPIAAAFRAWQQAEDDCAQAQELLTDPEMRELAQEELRRARQERDRLSQELKTLLLPRDPNDDKNTIVEIRSAAGGDEAAIFAGDLYKMYERLAAAQGWKTETMDASPSEAGGFKEIQFKVKGDHVYSVMKFESGVHRVQRVPETESGGRVHTSTATVAVLPEMEQADVDLRPEDIEMQVYRSSGAGGQHINKTSSAIRVTHLPTGMVVECQDQRSQRENKDRALKVLRSRLLQQKQDAYDEEYNARRQSQVGSGDRSEKIRTYNFPQDRVTDHRIGLTLRNLQGVLDGDLDRVVEPLILADREEKLKQSSTEEGK